MKDLEQTIISQYANSPTLLTIIENMNDAIDPAADIDSFYSMVWDVDTAQGFGLDIWGEIVGVSRLLVVPASDEYLGFDESNSWEPFGQSPLYNGPKTGAYELSDDAFRTLIFLKALSNISTATAGSYNLLLQRMFAGRGRCYAINLERMRMQLVFEFYLKPYEIAIIEQSGAFLPPAGVSLALLEVDMNATMGFAEATEDEVSYQPFGYGAFTKPSIQVT